MTKLRIKVWMVGCWWRGVKGQVRVFLALRQVMKDIWVREVSVSRSGDGWKVERIEGWRMPGRVM